MPNWKIFFNALKLIVFFKFETHNQCLDIETTFKVSGKLYSIYKNKQFHRINSWIKLDTNCDYFLTRFGFDTGEILVVNVVISRSFIVLTVPSPARALWLSGAG